MESWGVQAVMGFLLLHLFNYWSSSQRELSGDVSFHFTGKNKQSQSD